MVCILPLVFCTTFVANSNSITKYDVFQFLVVTGSLRLCGHSEKVPQTILLSRNWPFIEMTPSTCCGLVGHSGLVLILIYTGIYYNATSNQCKIHFMNFFSILVVCKCNSKIIFAALH